MSVGSVSGAAQRWDLVGALRPARPVSATGPFGADSAGAAAESGRTTKATSSAGTGSAPPLSSDLMASLLKIQADASQGGSAGGASAKAAAAGAGADTAQAAPSGTGQAYHGHRRHAAAAQADGSAKVTAPAKATAPGTDAAPASKDAAGGDFGSFLQQVTKAAAAYATGGPLGLAASALTTPAA